jgi:hypothetical protein
MVARITSWVGVDADQARSVTFETGLFVEFSQGRRFGRLPVLDKSARKSKRVLKWRIFAPYQQNPATIVKNDGVCRNPWSFLFHSRLQLGAPLESCIKARP